jgi:sterol desaturase/sphingolipid hydroxylase (fatty acid hydroxylase superfamily)
MTDIDLYTFGFPIIVVMIIAETIYSKINNLSLYKLNDSMAGFGLLAGNIVVNIGTKGAILFFYFYLYEFRIFTINDLISTTALWILTFVAIDFVYYWYHRFSHRVRFMWAVHMNHHSSEEMNFTVALRQAWFGPITKVPFFFILPIIGFDPLITALAGVAATLWGVTGHTQVIKTLGPLEYILVTPSSHRVHHGSNPEYIDKNYGNMFIVWDRLFGTFAKEESKVIFGITENVKTYNPVKITFMNWLKIIEDFGNSANHNDRFKSIFGPPEWNLDKNKNL